MKAGDTPHPTEAAGRNLSDLDSPRLYWPLNNRCFDLKAGDTPDPLKQQAETSATLIPVRYY